MERYKRGKVYRIVCRKTGKQYIGSTCKKLLSQRLAGHNYNFKEWKKNNFNFITSFTILEENDYYIELVELVPCSSNDELKVRERFHIQNNECVNKYIPLKTQKEHYDEHKEERLEYAKEYRAINKKQIAEKKKEKYDCPCGLTICKVTKSTHEKSKKHQTYLNNTEKLL